MQKSKSDKMKKNLKSKRDLILVGMLCGIGLLIIFDKLQSSEEKESARNKANPNQQSYTEHGTYEVTPLPRSRRDHAWSEHESRVNQADGIAMQQKCDELMAPLREHMSSTMFHVEIPRGQSLVTGGYPMADGRNHFTFLHPEILHDRHGRKQIKISSKQMAMSQQDVIQAGLNTLATNAKNTLQHAELWDEQDVLATMSLIDTAGGSEHLGEPATIIEPGSKFLMELIQQDARKYTLHGTAELSSDRKSVIIKARIQEKDELLR